jgi:hypothetical protein
MGLMGSRVLSALGLGSTAARVATPTARVLGHHPGYLQAGEALGAKVFDIPLRIWDKMSDGARWAANQKFLDRGIAEGAEFVMATRPQDVRAGSYLAREIGYLLEKGYRWADDGMSLVPK